MRFKQSIAGSIVCTAAAALLGLLYSAEAKKVEYPNIVIILADDMGYGDLSCQNADAKLMTPYLDRLASEGLRFSNAHSSGAVCVPSRYGMMTGRMPWRKGAQLGTNNHGPLIEEDRITLPKVLKNVGYKTAAFGKWHLGWNWPWKEGLGKKERKKEDHSKMDFTRAIGGGPLEAGFDYSFGVDHPTFPNVFIENEYALGIPDTEAVIDNNGKTALGVEGWDVYDMLPELTRRVVRYIEDRAADGLDKPFFIYFGMTAPHTPLVPAKVFQGKSEAGPYGDFVVQCDHTVGQVLQALERTGFAENTLVIFTSDNGSPAKNSGSIKGTIAEETGHNPSGIQRGFKGDAWEGGHHVPFIVKWPGKTSSNKVSDELLCQVDMLATFAAITGQEKPGKGGEDSLNALPLFLGKSAEEDGRDYLVHHAQTLFHTRENQWKLIFGSGSGGLEKHAGKTDPDAWQLYDLSKDPGEQNNLYGKFPEVVERLDALMKREKNKYEGAE